MLFTTKSNLERHVVRRHDIDKSEFSKYIIKLSLDELEQQKTLTSKLMKASGVGVGAEKHSDNKLLLSVPVGMSSPSSGCEDLDEMMLDENEHVNETNSITTTANESELTTDNTEQV